MNPFKRLIQSSQVSDSISEKKLDIEIQDLNQNDKDYIIDKDEQLDDEIQILGDDRYFGRNWVFLFDKKGYPRITLGPHWLVFVITFCINAYLQGFFFVLLKKQSFIFLIVQLLLGIFQLLSFLATGLVNPGIVTSYYVEGSRHQIENNYATKIQNTVIIAKFVYMIMIITVLGLVSALAKGILDILSALLS